MMHPCWQGRVCELMHAHMHMWNCSYLASINWHEFRWSRSVCATLPVAGGGHSHVSASVLMARGKGHMGSKRGGAGRVQ